MTTTQSRTVATPRVDQLLEAQADGRAPGRDPAGEWLAKRGVLFLLVQAPVLGILVTYLAGLERLTSALFPVFVAFSGLTVWVVYRNAKSTDRREPARRLHVYALYALLPVAVFHLVQALFLGASHRYWVWWLEIGTQFTGFAVNPWSFLAGAVWSLLIGVCLVIGYYLLFRRHNLANAAVYFGLALLASVYLFPNFSPVTAQVGTGWYLAQVAGFAAFAIAAATMPRFWAWWGRTASGRVHRPDGPRVLALAAAALVLLAPYALAGERTANQLLGEQEASDLAAFAQLTLVAQGAPVLVASDARTASYEYTLRLGPRTYTAGTGAQRAVDVTELAIEGRLEVGGTVAAWCATHVAEVESPNAVRAPAAFALEASRLDEVDVTLSCAGPASAVGELLCPAGGSVSASWRAEATLRGEQATQVTELDGRSMTRVELGDSTQC